MEFMGHSFQSKNKHLIDMFIQWFILPPWERGENEQNLSDMAKKYNVMRETLYNWQRCDYFIKEVERYTRADNSSRLKNVKNTLYAKAMTGDVQAIRLYKEWIAGVNEKIDLNQSGEVNLNVKVATLKDCIKAAEDEDEAKNNG
jgi:hypothetical protein